MAMCFIAVVAVAPCQCFKPGGSQTTSRSPLSAPSSRSPHGAKRNAGTAAQSINAAPRISLRFIRATMPCALSSRARYIAEPFPAIQVAGIGVKTPVARMERSGMRERPRNQSTPLPDFASLHPGYDAVRVTLSCPLHRRALPRHPGLQHADVGRVEGDEVGAAAGREPAQHVAEAEKLGRVG